MISLNELYAYGLQVTYRIETLNLKGRMILRREMISLNKWTHPILHTSRYPPTWYVQSAPDDLPEQAVPVHHVRPVHQPPATDIQVYRAQQTQSQVSSFRMLIFILFLFSEESLSPINLNSKKIDKQGTLVFCQPRELPPYVAAACMALYGQNCNSDIFIRL